MIYRTRVECRSTGDQWVSYCGREMESALDALHSYRPWRGEVATCESRTLKGRWVPLVIVHGGKPQTCAKCGGTGDRPGGGQCVGCQGRGVK